MGSLPAQHASSALQGLSWHPLPPQQHSPQQALTPWPSSLRLQGQATLTGQAALTRSIQSQKAGDASLAHGVRNAAGAASSAGSREPPRDASTPQGASLSKGASQARGGASLARASLAEVVGTDPGATGESQGENSDLDFTVVMKFGGSSIANSERMREVARLVTSFENERPVLVLSAMGKTTNNLLSLGEKAQECGTKGCHQIEELQTIRDLHVNTAKDLGIETPPEVLQLLEELEQLITGIALMRELTNRTRYATVQGCFILHSHLAFLSWQRTNCTTHSTVAQLYIFFHDSPPSPVQLYCGW